MQRHEISKQILADLMKELAYVNDTNMDKSYFTNGLRWLGHVIEQDEEELKARVQDKHEIQECKQRLIQKLKRFAEEAMPIYRDADQLKALMLDIMSEVDNVYKLGLQNRS